MNTDTGQVYRLGHDTLRSASLLHGFAAAAQERELTADETAALEDLRAGATIVPVSEQVAQQMIVGGRELERRRRRNKAARAARKRNR